MQAQRDLMNKLNKPATPLISRLAQPCGSWVPLFISLQAGTGQNCKVLERKFIPSPSPSLLCGFPPLAASLFGYQVAVTSSEPVSLGFTSSQLEWTRLAKMLMEAPING